MAWSEQASGIRPSNYTLICLDWLFGTAFYLLYAWFSLTFTQLRFSFQAAVIVWALAVAVGGALLAYFVDDALFTLGRRRVKTARKNCILVAWGFETQHRLTWTKVDFMIVLYITTFLLCMAL